MYVHIYIYIHIHSYIDIDIDIDIATDILIHMSAEVNRSQLIGSITTNPKGYNGARIHVLYMYSNFISLRAGRSPKVSFAGY